MRRPDADRCPLVRLVERGVVVAAASRYMRGGQQIGGPVLKSTSVASGRSFIAHAHPGGNTATPPTRSRPTPAAFVREVGIESDHGFEVGLELVAKARRRRLRVAEIPTIWLERSFGQSELPSGAMDPQLSPVVSLRLRSKVGFDELDSHRADRR